MRKWRCAICNHIYDEAKGDPDGGIAPGTTKRRRTASSSTAA
jgi:rubredoxin